MLYAKYVNFKLKFNEYLFNKHGPIKSFANF